MKTLNYETLAQIDYRGFIQEEAPERVIQFGEGNFMRAFVDYFIDVMNEKAGFKSKVVLVQPIGAGQLLKEMLNEQEGLYTLYLRGIKAGEKVNEKRIISCVSRCLNPYDEFEEVLKCAENPDLRFITCNTTEAGIVYDPGNAFTDRPAETYPGKLTQFLYRRFQAFGSEVGKGFIILACELIDDNGQVLKQYVLDYAKEWNLGADFCKWLEAENIFCSTLVDRIVTGYPRDEAELLNVENGYVDNLIDTGEIFASWVIEGPESLMAELPFAQAGLPVLITDDHKPYKQRKVRILNGAHTSFVLGAYLAGQDIVRHCMADEVIQGFMNATIVNEIIPTLTLPQKELSDFAAAVGERFKNPYIDHALLDISLNSTAKWKARVLPSLKAYVAKTGELPQCLTASFAFYIAFYRGFERNEGGLVARRGDNTYTIKDDAAVLDFFLAHQKDDLRSLAGAVCANEDFWGEDLSAISGFTEAVGDYLQTIDEKGSYAVMKSCLSN